MPRLIHTGIAGSPMHQRSQCIAVFCAGDGWLVLRSQTTRRKQPAPVVVIKADSAQPH